MLDWETQHISQQLRYGPYLGSRQLYELGVMMLSEGEPHLKLPRLNTSSSTPTADSRMNEQSVRQYLSMHLAEANKVKETINSNMQGAASAVESRQCVPIPSRKQREFINDTYKDEHYWEKRRKNNDAARRSREKRRYHDMVLEGRIRDLTKDNCLLRDELTAIKRKYNLPLDQPFTDNENDSQISGAMPVRSSSPNVKYSQNTSQVQHLPSSKGVPYSSPPPLLAVTSAMGVPVQSIYPPNGAQYPYYLNMPGSEPSSIANHDTTNGSNNSIYTTSPRNSSAPTTYNDVTVKEERDDSKSPPPLSIVLENGARPPVSRESSYDYYQHQGYSSDSWQGSPSNSNSYGSDEHADQPLELTTRQDSTEANDHPSGKKESKSPQASSFPLKLRHKLPTQDYYSPIDPAASFPPRPYVNGLAQLSEIALAQANPIPLTKKNTNLPPSSMNGYTPGMRMKDKSGNPKYIDPKYIERRRRNNEAARKCRENRKYVTTMREAKSEYLQQENGKLKDELDSLQEEMKQLRELMEKKRLEQGLTEQEMNEKMNEKLSEVNHHQQQLQQQQQQLQKEMLEAVEESHMEQHPMDEDNQPSSS